MNKNKRPWNLKWFWNFFFFFLNNFNVKYILQEKTLLNWHIRKKMKIQNFLSILALIHYCTVGKDIFCKMFLVYSGFFKRKRKTFTHTHKSYSQVWCQIPFQLRYINSKSVMPTWIINCEVTDRVSGVQPVGITYRLLIFGGFKIKVIGTRSSERGKWEKY